MSPRDCLDYRTETDPHLLTVARTLGDRRITTTSSRARPAGPHRLTIT